MTEPSSSPREFNMQIDIAAPRDAVWQAISNDHELRRWFAPEARIDGEVGGEVVWKWGELHNWPQRIEILEPGTRLRTRYDSTVEGADGKPEPLYIDFLLEGDGGHTSLRIVHSGFGAAASFDEEFDGISRGWPVELRSLRLYLENHGGKDRQIAWSMKQLDMTPEAAWQRLTAADVFDCDSDLDSLREGSAFRIRCATGDVFEGEVLTMNSQELTGVARSHGDGFFRIHTGGCGGGTIAWLWLATYGQPAGEAEALQARWDEMLGTVFAEHTLEQTEDAQ